MRAGFGLGKGHILSANVAFFVCVCINAQNVRLSNDGLTKIAHAVEIAVRMLTGLLEGIRTSRQKKEASDSQNEDQKGGK